MDTVKDILFALDQLNRGKIHLPGAAGTDFKTMESLTPSSEFLQDDQPPAWVSNIVLTRDNGECAFCGRPDVEVHHIVTRMVGDHSPDNLITLCLHCHRQLTHKMNVPFDYSPYVELG